MNIDVITQYILALVPAVTALVGMAVTIGLGVAKIKKANKETVETVDASNKKVCKHTESLESQLANVHKENVELKRQLTKVMKKLDHVHFVDDKEE